MPEQHLPRANLAQRLSHTLGEHLMRHCTQHWAPWVVTVCSCAVPAMAAEMPKSVTVQGHFQELALDNPGSGPAIVSVDDEDRVWVALARAGKLAMYSGGKVRTFDLGANSRPVGVIAGTKQNGYPGSVWIAASYDNKIIRYDWQTGQRREYPIPGTESWPFNIALDAKGHVWFTQRAAGAIGKLDPVSGEFTQLPLPRPGSGPAGLGIDAKSGRVWFTESYKDTLASLDPATGQVTEIAMGQASTGLVSGPAGLVVDGEGGVWFAKLEGQLGYLPPGASQVQLMATPANAARPAGVTLDAQGNPWLVALDGNSLLSYQRRDKQFVVYPLPVGEQDAQPSSPPFARSSRPFGLAFDSSGNLWFSQQYTGQLGVLDLAKPELKLMSPGPEVKAADPYVTVQALDSLVGEVTVRYEMDGAAVALRNGRLDLTHATPGEHELKVVATDAAGLSNSQSRRFRYLPAPESLPTLIGALRFKSPEPKALRDALLMTANDSGKAQRVDDLRGMLATHREQLAADEYASISATLEWMAGGRGSEQVVTILDREPFFEPRQVELKPGGSVAWMYQGEKQGHEISHELHQIEVASLQVKSPLMRAGDRFVQRFDTPGSYTVLDSRKPGAALQVTVLQP